MDSKEAISAGNFWLYSRVSNNRTVSITHNGKLSFIEQAKKDNLMLFLRLSVLIWMLGMWMEGLFFDLAREGNLFKNLCTVIRDFRVRAHLSIFESSFETREWWGSHPSTFWDMASSWAGSRAWWKSTYSIVPRWTTSIRNHLSEELWGTPRVTRRILSNCRVVY